MSLSPEALKAKILQAFGGVAYPGDAYLVTEAGYDPESRDVAAAFRGKDWKAVSPRLVREQAEALPLFTPNAFRYFLPAYLLASIDAGDEVDVALDAVIFNLTPPRESTGWQKEFFESRSNGVTSLQADAISEFLQLLDEREKAGWAEVGMPPPQDRFGRALAYWKGRIRRP